MAAPTIRAIPPIPAETPKATARVLRALKENVETLSGLRGGKTNIAELLGINVAIKSSFPGIQDDATGVRLNIRDNEIRVGTAGENYEIGHSQLDRVVHYSGGQGIVGGTGANRGGNVVCFGPSYSGNGGSLYLRSGTNAFMTWAEPTGILTFLTGTGAKNQALQINSVQDAIFEGNVTVGAGKGTSPASLLIGDATLTTGTASIELGNQRSGAGATFIDFHAENVTYTDYALRLIRNSDANGTSTLRHRGTGSLFLVTQDAAAIEFQTNSITAFSLNTIQQATFAEDVRLATTKRLYFDGGSNSYIWESAADLISIVTGGSTTFQCRVSEVLFPQGVTENAVSVAASTIDCHLGTYFYKTITGATTFAFTNPATSGEVTAFTLELTNGGVASVTWPTSVDWAGGIAPTLVNPGVDILTFLTRDGGVTWHGAVFSSDSK